MLEQTDTATPRTVAAAYLDLLAEEGYRPKLAEGDGEDGFTVIRFRSEGTTFLLCAYEDDPEYLRLGASYDLGDDPHDAELLAVLANQINDRLKAVKCVLDLDSNGVRFVVESFLTGQRVTGALIERATSALRTAADDFFAGRRPPDRLDA